MSIYTTEIDNDEITDIESLGVLSRWFVRNDIRRRFSSYFRNDFICSNCSVLKLHERCIYSCICNLTAAVLLGVALIYPSWIFVTGGGCNANYLGLLKFFYNGHFSIRASAGKTHFNDIKYHYSSQRDSVLVNCVTPEAVSRNKVIISFLFITILNNLIAFFLDVVQLKNKVFRLMRENAVHSIISVLLCVVICGLTFSVATLVETLQQTSKLYDGSKVVVMFSYSFYIVVASAALSVLATACTCFRLSSLRRRRRRSVLTDHEQLMDGGVSINTASSVPMPPPYSP